MPPGKSGMNEKVIIAQNQNVFDMYTHMSTHCGIMTQYGDLDLVNFGSGNTWLPAGTKQLPDTKSTYQFGYEFNYIFKIIWTSPRPDVLNNM